MSGVAPEGRADEPVEQVPEDAQKTDAARAELEAELRSIRGYGEDRG
ncbi:hypothetical protein [Microbacterium aureliae]